MKRRLELPAEKVHKCCRCGGTDAPKIIVLKDEDRGYTLEFNCCRSCLMLLREPPAPIGTVANVIKFFQIEDAIY